MPIMALASFTFEVKGSATSSSTSSSPVPPVIVYKLVVRRTHRERFHDKSSGVLINYQDYEFINKRKANVLRVSILDEPPSVLREHVDELLTGINVDLEPPRYETLAEAVIMKTLDTAEEHNRTCHIIIESDLEIHTENVVYVTSLLASSKSTRKRPREAAFKVGSDDDLGSADVNDSCSVCLDEFRTGMELIKTQCDHIFHKECILRWLESKKSCPMCRLQIN